MIDNFHWYIYAMQKTDKGWFAQMQFDQRFKGDIDEVIGLLSIVTKHTVGGDSGTKIRFCVELINLEGYFADDILGEEIHKLFISRIQNKPKCYNEY